MRTRVSSATAVAALIVVGLSGCGSSTTSGHPTNGGQPKSGGFGSSTSAGPAPTQSGANTPVPSSSTQQPLRTITVTGLDPAHPGPYTLTLWATDRLTGNCAAHSYGKVVDFFRAHECRTAGRFLWTLPHNGRTVALAIEAVAVATGPESDVYEYAGQFTQLEQADGTGSINDLLREGKRIPDAASSIPANEAFSVLSQDTGVAVFDAWYTTGATTSQDPDLVALEESLFLTDASAFG